MLMKIKHSEHKIIYMLLGENFLGRLFLLFMVTVYPHDFDSNRFYSYILLWIFVIYIWSKRIKDFYKKPDSNPTLLPDSEKVLKPKTTELMAIIAMIGFSIIIYYLLYGTFKLQYLFESHMKLFGSIGLLTFFIQTAFFIAEIITMGMLVSRVQELELKRREFIPYGGIFLALTWGASHFITGSSLAGNILMDLTWRFSDVFSSYTLITGFYYLMISLLSGIIFMILKRNYRYAFPAIILLYLL